MNTQTTGWKHDHLFLRKTNCSDCRNFSTSFEDLPRFLQTIRLTDVVNVYAYFKLLYWPARSVLSLSCAYERKYRNYKLLSQTLCRWQKNGKTFKNLGQLQTGGWAPWHQRRTAPAFWPWKWCAILIDDFCSSVCLSV